MANRLNNRLCKMWRGTHGFVPSDVLYGVRLYLQQRFQEVDKPADLDQVFEEIEELRKRLRLEGDAPWLTARLCELVDSSEAAWLKFMTPDVEKPTTRAPEGFWLKKLVADLYIELAAEAKQYFRERTS